jgi:hypothetical protein
MKRIALGVVLTASLSMPASAQLFGTMPVIDVTNLAKNAVTAAQTLQTVNALKQGLLGLPAGLNLGNIQARISTVTSMLQTARNVCLSAAAAPTVANSSPSSACNVSSNVAQAQAANFGSELAHLTALEQMARGTTGGLQAAQAQASAEIELATQLYEYRQQVSADAAQRASEKRAELLQFLAPPSL